jgi:hypothetical protein
MIDKKYLNRKFYYEVMSLVDKVDESIKTDLIQEILSELTNPEYTTDEQRVEGVAEAVRFVLDYI